MMTSKTADYYRTRAKNLSGNGKDNARIVSKLNRQARKAEKEQ